jgi:hypothetical protein
VEQVGEQLLDSPRSLGSVADHIKKALSRVEFDMSEDARSDELRQDARAVASLAERFAAPFYGESWTNDVDIGAGPWILHLTGSSRPTPQLTITLREYSVCGAVSHVGSAFAGLWVPQFGCLPEQQGGFAEGRDRHAASRWRGLGDTFILPQPITVQSGLPTGIAKSACNAVLPGSAYAITGSSDISSVGAPQKLVLSV